MPIRDVARNERDVWNWHDSEEPTARQVSLVPAAKQKTRVLARNVAIDPEPTYASRGRVLGQRAIHVLAPDFGLGFNASRKEVSLCRQSAPNVSWQLS